MRGTRAAPSGQMRAPGEARAPRPRALAHTGCVGTRAAGHDRTKGFKGGWFLDRQRGLLRRVHGPFNDDPRVFDAALFRPVPWLLNMPLVIGDPIHSRPLASCARSTSISCRSSSFGISRPTGRSHNSSMSRACWRISADALGLGRPISKRRHSSSSLGDSGITLSAY